MRSFYKTHITNKFCIRWSEISEQKNNHGSGFSHADRERLQLGGLLPPRAEGADIKVSDPADSSPLEDAQCRCCINMQSIVDFQPEVCTQ